MDRKLGLAKEYIQFQAKQSKNAGGSIGSMLLDSDTMDYEYGGGGAWGDDDPDETVMQDFDDVM